MIRSLLFFFAFFFCAAFCQAQQVLPLYSGSIPNARPVADKQQVTINKELDTVLTEVSVPTLTAYFPPANTASGASVIICPGGGYHALMYSWEGIRIARAFNKVGVAAFILKYRLPSDRTLQDKSIGPLQDAQQAIKTVREKAAQWKLDPHRIGIMGFSAGGHLASSAGTHFGHAYIENKNGTSLRPDFMLLIYPVISFTDSIGHVGSRDNLLGAHPSPEQIRLFSNELQVDAHTPPTFLAHAVDDKVVLSQNSLYFYEALHHSGVPAELHLYEKGEHGFITAPPFDEWFNSCIYWMKSNKWIR
ncbi:alpha/beta hydrolase [Compostibacter hankyongensis]|uniref:Alpha/beta hydrolase n=2 Tax=Compostibacter hankyongensis TaxID=1007089 RepID=A0ABP8G8V9_9BACT